MGRGGGKDDGGEVGRSGRWREEWTMEGGEGRNEEEGGERGRWRGGETIAWISATKLRSPDISTPSQNNPKIHLEKQCLQIADIMGVRARGRPNFLEGTHCEQRSLSRDLTTNSPPQGAFLADDREVAGPHGYREGVCAHEPRYQKRRIHRAGVA